MAVAWNNLVYIFSTDLSKTMVPTQKHMIVAHVAHSLVNIITIEAALLKTNLKILDAVRHKPA